MKHFNITVHGKVQGVYFRASTRDEAERLGIHGYVRNLPDGNVYLEAEGDEEAMQRLLFWLESGPPAARVDKLDIVSGDIKGMKGFEVRR